MGTADQDPDTPDAGEGAPPPDHGAQSDTGGDSDPTAAASSEATGEDQAQENRDEDPPA